MSESQTPSRPLRRSEQTRARLLDAALEVFLERGYDDAATGEITKRAHLGAGTYYLHFRDKRAIYEALIRRNLLTLKDRWTAARVARPSRGQLQAEVGLMVEVVLGSVLEDPRVGRLVLLDGPPVETWLVEEIGREMADVFGDRIASPELVANLVIGVTLAAARWALMRSRGVPPQRLLAQASQFSAAGAATAGIAIATPET